MAAAVCIQKHVKLRGVYEKHLEALKTLMRKGVGKEGARSYPDYNLGGTLLENMAERKL